MLSSLLSQLHPLNPPATDAAILAAESALSRTFPSDYKSFLKHTNGFEGTPYKDNYIRLEPVEELLINNIEYEVQLTRPELLYFGGNGGGEGYFFDMSTPGPEVLMIPFISNWKEVALWHGSSFTDFLAKIMSDWSPFKLPR